MLRAVKSFTHVGSLKKKNKKKIGATNSTRKNHILRTARGSLVGVEISDTKSYQPIYHLYARVRYALPPTGSRRWRRPEPLPADWIFSNGDDDLRDYRRFGPICPQLGGESGAVDITQWEEVEDVVMDEDCLYLNIWVPAGVETISKGWPVQFIFPPGGLQCGHGMQQNYLDPIDLFREHHEEPRIIVSANYRVGILGFLASEELMVDGMDPATRSSDSAGNFGLWDLRMALQWTYDHIHLFGGNPNNISAGGSGLITALQLHYDAFQPPDNRIIRRAFLFSGAVSIQPEPAHSFKPSRQFDEICSQLLIELDLSGEEKIQLLRNVPVEKLLSAVRTLEIDFKPVTDGEGGFVPMWLMASIWNGELGRRLKQRNVQVVIGDSRDERLFYEHTGRVGIQPSRPSRTIFSRDALMSKLKAHYPTDICNELVQRYARDITDWNSVYCDIMADVQCHAATRGFAQCLMYGGMTTHDVLRYHIAWRPQGVDDWISPDAGVSHVMDMPIWLFSGWRAGFSKKDKHDVLVFTAPFSRFLTGGHSARIGWSTDEEFEVRLLSPSGAAMVAEDQMWARKLDVWNTLRDVQRNRVAPRADSVVQTNGG